MSVRLHRTAVGLVALATAMAMAVPAMSEEDRPDEVPPDEPVAEPDGSGGADEGGVSADTHGQTGDFDDFVSIRNQTGTGLSRLNLNTTDSQVINGDTWRLANDADTGNFSISEGGTTDRLVMEQGGNVGLGIADPLSPLHISRSGGFQLRLDSGGTADYRFDAFGTSLRIGDSSNSNQFRIFGADAPFNALVIRDGIGIGTSSPEVDLDIRNITGNTSTKYAITGTGGDKWTNGVTPGGLFQFNRAATGGAEFLVRERNHASSTLDVDGPVRATAFNITSGKAFKTGFAPVNESTVLDKLNQLGISSWQFKACKPGQGRLEHEDDSAAAPCTGPGKGPRHIGPMAEDFQRVFGLGDGESISLTDANGIMMAAIQALTEQLQERDDTIEAMEDKLSDLESRLEALEDQSDGSGNGRPGNGRN